MSLSIYQSCLKHLQKKAPLLTTYLKLSSHDENAAPIGEPLELHETTNAIVYGFYPHSHKSILNWLDQNPSRHLLFFEDHLENIQSMLKVEASLKLVSHPRVHLFYLSSPQFWQQHKKRILPHLGTDFEVVKAPLKSHDLFEGFEKKITSIIVDENSRFSEYLFSSPLVYENIKENLNMLDGSKLSTDLKDQFLNVPAIICGAGPSIEKNLPFLKALREKALIFAGGRALQILSKENILPHFSLGIDPYSMHAETFSENTAFERPLIYRLRMANDALKKAHTDCLYTPHGVGYPLVHELEKALDIHGPCLEEGLNVVNFAVQCAHYMGCGPIILVGCDLAYDAEHPYSQSIVLNQKLPKARSVETKDYSIHRGSLTQSGEGREVYTLWKWTQEAKWLSEFSKKHPQTRFYNTSSRGIKIDYFTLMELEQLKKEVLVRSYDLDSKVHAVMAQIQPIKVEPEKLSTSLAQIKKSLENCAQYLNKIIEDPKSSILELEDLYCEVAYLKMLKNLEHLFDQVEIVTDETLKKKAEFLLTYTQKYLEVFK